MALIVLMIRLDLAKIVLSLAVHLNNDLLYKQSVLAPEPRCFEHTEEQQLDTFPNYFMFQTLPLGLSLRLAYLYLQELLTHSQPNNIKALI